MSGPCRASKRIGCPDCQTQLICYQPYPHPGLNHYDAQEQVWWMVGDIEAEPELYRAGRASARTGLNAGPGGHLPQGAAAIGSAEEPSR